MSGLVSRVECYIGNIIQFFDLIIYFNSQRFFQPFTLLIAIISHIFHTPPHQDTIKYKCRIQDLEDDLRNTRGELHELQHQIDSLQLERTNYVSVCNINTISGYKTASSTPYRSVTR